MTILKEVEEAAEVATGGLNIQSKLIIAAGLFVLACIGFEWGAHHYEARGRTLERAEWLKKQVDWDKATAKLVADNEQHNRAVAADNQAKERKTSEIHEQELAKLASVAAAARRRADAAGGLRISANVCPATSSPAGGTEAAGASGRDEAGAGTVALPADLQDSLWALVNEADQTSAQLRACQGWIRLNGFYGAPHDEPTEPAADPLQ